MGDVRLLGTVYVRNKPVPMGKNVGRYRADAPITIGDTVGGMECRWVMTGRMLVAERPLLQGIAFHHIKNRNLDTGIEVQIDGAVYRCRLLKADPSEDGHPSEWDRLKDQLLPAWGKITSIIAMQEGVVSVYNGQAHPVAYTYSPCSWYPVLEPLSPVILSEEAIGKGLLVSVGEGVVSGMLESVIDYDIVMSKVIASKVAPEHMLLIGNGKMVIMRDAVWAIREYRSSCNAK